MTELGVTEHFGDSAEEGFTEHESETLPLNPATDVMLKVELADPPGLILFGENAEAEIEKSGFAGAILKITPLPEEPHDGSPPVEALP